MTLALKDDLFDAQFVRALAYAEQGGAELGECLGTASRITKTDGDLWYEQWSHTAGRVRGIAETASAAGDMVRARGAYFRASNYFRTAGLFLMGVPVDQRLRASAGQQTATFRKGAELLDLPPDILQIPYEDTNTHLCLRHRGG